MDDYDKAVFLQQTADEIEARFRDWLPERSRPEYDAYVKAEQQLLSDFSRAFSSATVANLSYETLEYSNRVVDNFRPVIAMRRKWAYWRRKWSLTDGFDPRTLPTMIVEHTREEHNHQIETTGSCRSFTCPNPTERA